jgi:hypothetical protein
MESSLGRFLRESTMGSGVGWTLATKLIVTLLAIWQVVDQQHRSLHLKRSIIHATPPAPPFCGHSAVSFPSAAEDMAKINEIGYKHFASRGFTSILDRVWRRRGSARSKTEPKQVSIKDLAVLDNWLSQLKKCAQRYGQQGEPRTQHVGHRDPDADPRQE